LGFPGEYFQSTELAPDSSTAQRAFTIKLEAQQQSITVTLSARRPDTFNTALGLLSGAVKKLGFNNTPISQLKDFHTTQHYRLLTNSNNTQLENDEDSGDESRLTFGR